MSTHIKQKLQDILDSSINNQQFERAEKAVSHLRELADIEAFIREEPGPFSQEKSVTHNNIQTTEQAGARENINKENLVLYYIEEDNLFKFKKSQQTYAVSVEFFRIFLKNIKAWKDRDPFSSKTYYDTFSRQLQEMSSYQHSTLRQFITLLFRFSYKLGVLQKPNMSQRSRYVTAEPLDVDRVLNHIFDKKVLYL